MSDIILRDIGGRGLDLLICGYNPGVKSACRGHYFSNKGNRFWQIVAETKLAPKLEPEQDHTLPNHGIGLTDLLKDSVHGASAGPTESDRERLRKLILDWKPTVVAFLGKKPAAGFLNTRKLSWGHLERHVGPTELWVVPDPSGGNGHFRRLRIHWDGLAVRILSDRARRRG